MRVTVHEAAIGAVVEVGEAGARIADRMWQLVYAGLAGGRKGVPEQVAEHPQVFAS